MAGFETLTWFVPIQRAQDTWDDGTRSAEVGLLDPAARRLLSAHYSSLERVETLETDWSSQTDELEAQYWDVQSPVERLSALEVAFPEVWGETLVGDRLSAQPPGVDQLESIVEVL